MGFTGVGLVQVESYVSCEEFQLLAQWCGVVTFWASASVFHSTDAAVTLMWFTSLWKEKSGEQLPSFPSWVPVWVPSSMLPLRLFPSYVPIWSVIKLALCS